MKPDWPLLAGLGLLGAAVYLGGTETGRNLVADLSKKGRRLTRTSLDADLKVPVDPETLAAAAAAVIGRPVTLAAYSMARMLRSEEGSGSTQVKRYLGHVATNDAHELAWTLPRLFTYSTKAERKGFFGKQISRRYSTAQDPYEIDLAVAELVINERDSGGADPTAGATKFVNKTAFAFQAGASSYEAVRARWMADGYEPFVMAGAPDLVFFRRKRRPLVT